MRWWHCDCLGNERGAGYADGLKEDVFSKGHGLLDMGDAIWLEYQAVMDRRREMLGRYLASSRRKFVIAEREQESINPFNRVHLVRTMAVVSSLFLIDEIRFFAVFQTIVLHVS